MAYIQVRRGKPSMYQQDDGMWVCQGRDQVALGASQRGAYTRWKNMVELAEAPSDIARRITKPVAVNPFAALSAKR